MNGFCTFSRERRRSLYASHVAGASHCARATRFELRHTTLVGNTAARFAFSRQTWVRLLNIIAYLSVLNASKIVNYSDGNFGEVYRGLWRGGIEVAIKTMKAGTMSNDAFLGYDIFHSIHI